MSLVRYVWLVACLSVASSRRLSSILYDRLIIPDDRTVSVLIAQPGQAVNRFYVLQKDVQALSITVIPCGTPVAWELNYRSSNQTGKVEVEGGSEAVKPMNGVVEQKHKLVAPAARGLYTVRLNSAQEAQVEVYATFMGLPSQLWPTGRIVAKSRPAKGTVFLRWPRKTVDPELTEYVLVVHQSQTAFHSLCQARDRQLHSNNIIMEKTGHRTSWLVRGLQADQAYRAEVFAIHTATNYSYRYAELPRLLYSRPKPRPLHDGVQVSVELRLHEPTMLFRYKVRQEKMERLDFGVTACGQGSLVAEVKVRGGGVHDSKQVKGHVVLSVLRPPKDAIYILKLKLLPNSRPVSVQVTARGEEPVLPDPAELHEFRGLRSCREVTLGWVPVSGVATYCLRASQSRRGDILRREPDQCLVEQHLNSLGYSVLQCSKIDSQDRKVISERLTNLKPGKQYDIQVSVKKGNSKRLSYKLVRVRTKSRCS